MPFHASKLAVLSRQFHKREERLKLANDVFQDINVRKGYCVVRFTERLKGIHERVQELFGHVLACAPAVVGVQFGAVMFTPKSVPAGECVHEARGRW